MTNQLTPRGPEGTRQLRMQSAAFGHTLLATTPEACQEVMPLVHSGTGCVISADARLDNRGEIIASLDLQRGSGRICGDGELILRSYLKWEHDCVERLRGDFAFAIWDPRKRQVFCARDQMGMRQFNYAFAPNKLFVFGTEARTVLAHPAVERRLNEARIGDFLASLEAYDDESTFFEGVCRLPPAHCMVVSQERLSIRRYWKLGPQTEMRLPSNQAYAEAFLDVFSQAVQSRLRSAKPVGCMLSGGLDSTSVAFVAAEQLGKKELGKLRTFSFVGSNKDTCRETRAILSALRKGEFAPTLVDATSIVACSEELLSRVEHCAEPFDALLNLNRALWLEARNAGLNVVLDGAGGDIVLDSGNPVSQMLRGGHWCAALADAKRSLAFWGPYTTTGRLVRSAAFDALGPVWLRRMVTKSRGRKRLREDTIVEPDFAAEIGLLDRHVTQCEALRVSLAEAHGPRGFSHRAMATGRERYDRVAGALGIEPRDPFLDLNVIRFCASLPADQLSKGGWPKFILRKAMADKLPQDVRWRRGKQHLGWNMTRDLLSDRVSDWRAEQENYATLRRYVRAEWLPARPIVKSVLTVGHFESYVLAQWLKNQSDLVGHLQD